MTEEGIKELAKEYIDSCTKRAGFVILAEGIKSDFIDLFVAGFMKCLELNKEIKWHKVADGDLPQPTGEYEHQSFPQIPCLCEIKKSYGVRYWNVKYQCWDDEDCDDAFCDKDGVDRWCYLDELI